ncbi:hypothetical protein OE09_1206 [Flavobacteriaceae bacterium MAR_2010_72]|nr:hypothetical protein OE09_1206 [Flavobacteriaceae bacterium MAR_2010_72]
MYRTIVEYLYHGFRPYVAPAKLMAYDEDFKKNAKNSLASVKAFFPKYVDISYYHKYPTRLEDVYLFNYFVIDLDVYGLKQTDTFKAFKRGMRY